ncbi:MAG: glycosyltransferase family 2 protein [Planctomycetota bacterium]
MKSEKQKLHVIVPVYNEASNIERFIFGINKLHAHMLSSGKQLTMILVNDGSTDATCDIAYSSDHSFELVILTHKLRRGPGAAFSTAFHFLLDKLGSGDLVLLMEGDNTSRIETAMQMVVRISEGYDVVLASPYAYGGGFSDTPAHRLILSHCANGLLKIFAGLRGIHTFSSFYRLFRGSIIIQLHRVYGGNILETDGFECMVELLIKLTLIKARISEVEMTLDTSCRRGKSKMRIPKTVIGYLKVLCKYRKWVGITDRGMNTA